MNSTNALEDRIRTLYAKIEWRIMRGAMRELRYWYLKCKVCKNLHRSEIAVTDSSHDYEFPAAGEIECPDSPRKKAHYSPSQDWIVMTEAEAQKLRKAPQPAREHKIRTA